MHVRPREMCYTCRSSMARLCGLSTCIVDRKFRSTAQTASALLRIPVKRTTTTAAAAEAPTSSSQQRPAFVASLLQTPTILYSSNHLLVVNKPPGWKSVPNQTTKKNQDDDIHNNTNKERKSLLHYLIHNLKAGGGSQHQFLLPLHRLDQPCSGVMLFGKTHKAASRIQPNWKFVKKTYLAVVEQEVLERANNRLLQQSALIVKDSQGQEWRDLCGIQRGKRPPRNDESNSKNNTKSSSSNVGWSVVIQPCRSPPSIAPLINEKIKNNNLCSLQWRVLTDNSVSTEANFPPTVCLLEIRTTQGGRHMIRALFAAHGCPLVGDSRYGNDTTAAAADGDDDGGGDDGDSDDMTMGTMKLPDRSVALHARSLYLPDDKIRLNLSERSFTAPIPSLWESLFGFDESSVANLLVESNQLEYDE